MPEWVNDKENQVLVLSLFFVFFIVIPFFVVWWTGNNEAGAENVPRYENGIDERSGTEMLRPLWEVLDRNMRKKAAKITDDQWVEVLEQSQEFYELNEERYAESKKVNIRDLIRNKIQGLKISTKFAEVEQEIDVLVPKLVGVLMFIFSDTDFVHDLLLFNSKT